MREGERERKRERGGGGDLLIGGGRGGGRGGGSGGPLIARDLQNMYACGEHYLENIKIANNFGDYHSNSVKDYKA